MNKRRVGKRIKQIRLLREITQDQLAKKTKVGRFKISKYENYGEKQLPSLYTLYRIAKALNISCDYLIGLSNNFNGD